MWGRFSSGLPAVNFQHPASQALTERGQAVKTMFLCRYLQEDPLRREIHDGLQVIENWNSANAFIFYGKGGEMALNRLEDRELATSTLHLLQVAMVYSNTLMVQQVLTDDVWWTRMTPDDLRALKPLIYTYMTPLDWI
jgi:TnpA family transposase